MKNDHMNACVYALKYGDSANLSSSESGSLTVQRKANEKNSSSHPLPIYPYAPVTTL